MYTMMEGGASKLGERRVFRVELMGGRARTRVRRQCEAKAQLVKAYSRRWDSLVT